MKKNKLFIAAFVALLALPTLDNIFHFSPVKTLIEKRLPVSMPPMPKTFVGATEFTQKFENFFNDNYGFRKTLITLNGEMMNQFFDETSSKRVLGGKDGWFYLADENSLDDAAGKAEVSDELLAKAIDVLFENWQEALSYKINYLLVIAPDKHSIYPEFLPDYIEAKGPHRLDKFLQALKKKYPDFPVLDLRPALLAAKKNEVLYHQTDTHWNKRGAYYAYSEIMKSLKIKPHLREEFSNKEDEMLHGDLAIIAGLGDKSLNYDLVANFKQEITQISGSKEEEKNFKKFEIFTNTKQNLPVIFVDRDSFADNLKFFFNPHFSRSFYANGPSCRVHYGMIQNYHPQIVIQEFVERRMKVIFNECQNDEKK